MNEAKRFSLIKPSINTPFHIDFAWWKQHENDYRVYLLGYLCSDHQKAFANLQADQEVDWVDPETAEVQAVDGLQQILITHCAKQEGFLTEHTTVVDAVFRMLLANGNSPLTPTDLGARLSRPADTILRTLAGPQVYKGIRPCPV
jgi:hypothetical protein